jgi:hypothetical protein
MPELPLTDKALQDIEVDFCRGMAGENELGRLIAACKLQREVLKILFSYWQREPEHLVYFAHSVRCRTMDDLRAKVAMENI